MKKNWVLMIMFLGLAALFFTGCPKEAREMIEEAENAMGEAREADAPRYAADEYLSAEESLSLAHEQFDKRKYPAAKSSAITARDQANLARDRAMEREQQETTETTGAEDELAYNVPSLYSEEELAAQEMATSIEVSEKQVKRAVLQDVHFDLDRHYLADEARGILAGNSRWMKEHPSVKIRIEGHCDERGTEEYNLALGEKRAQSAMNYLIQMGISPARLSTISYGESLPLDPGHNEEAWARNRRAHFAIIE